MILALLITALFSLAVVVTTRAVAHARDGFEDETGFHTLEPVLSRPGSLSPRNLAGGVA